MKKTLISATAVLAFAIFLLMTYFKFNTSGFLSFSDGAKYALVARSLFLGNGFTTIFSFWGSRMFATTGIPFLIPVLMSFFFRIFGASDLSVIAFSSFFYLCLVISVFFLGKRLFGNLVGALSAIAVAANVSFLNYATSGASEPLYTFVAVVSTYLLIIKKRWADVLLFISLIALYLTRPQAVVFIMAFLFCWFLYNFQWKKGLAMFAVLTAGIFFLDKLVLYPLSFKYPVYPIVTRGIQAIFQYSPATAVSDALRGLPAAVVSPKEVVIKVFYNLYNFYKLLPDIASPYMWGLFAVGIFIWGKDRSKNIFNLLTILAVIGTFLLAALTIPFYRYIHPVIPFVYIIASATMVKILGLLIKDYGFKDKTRIINLLSIIIILVFTVGQTLGVIFLDSRFERNMHNLGKPPVYAKLSYILRDNTNAGQIVVTNLDTWGSWYGERKTVWFPLTPLQLSDAKTGKIPFDAIYLTSYLIDDQNYYMGADWRQIFENPTDSRKWVCDGCIEISKEFKLKGVYSVTADQDYERQDAKGVLLVRK